MIEKFKEAITRGNEFDAPVTDLSTKIGCINHLLLTAKIYNNEYHLCQLTWFLTIETIVRNEPKLKKKTSTRYLI